MYRYEWSHLEMSVCFTLIAIRRKSLLQSFACKRFCVHGIYLSISFCKASISFQMAIEDSTPPVKRYFPCHLQTRFLNFCSSDFLSNKTWIVNKKQIICHFVKWKQLIENEDVLVSRRSAIESFFTVVGFVINGSQRCTLLASILTGSFMMVSLFNIYY